MKVKAGDKLFFHGCMWDEGWEFDAPAIIYSPIKRYGNGGSIPDHLETMVEDICIDLSLDEDVREGWSDFDLKEFAWRHWDPNGFCRRKRAWHVKYEVGFFLDGDNELSFSIHEVGRVSPKC